MSKITFFFVTLIAAIPAAFLGYQAIMAFLNFSGDMPTILMGVTGVTLLMCAIVVVLPIAVLLRRGSKADAMPEEAAEESTASDEEDDEFDDAGDFGDDDDEIVEEDDDMAFDGFDEDEDQR